MARIAYMPNGNEGSVDWSDMIPAVRDYAAPGPPGGDPTIDEPIVSRLDGVTAESSERLDRTTAPGEGIPKDVGRAFEAYRAWLQELLGLPRDVAYIVAWGSIGGAAWLAWRQFS